MAIRKLANKSQSIIEYIVVITLLVAVFIAIGAYYKRGLQGRLRQSADVMGSGEQYTATSP